MLCPGGLGLAPPPAWHPLPTVRGAASCPLPPTGARPRPSYVGVPPPLPDPISMSHPSAGCQETQKLLSPGATGASELHPTPPPSHCFQSGDTEVLGGLVLGPQGGRPRACCGGRARLQLGEPLGRGSTGERGPEPPHPCFTPMSPRHLAHTLMHACTLTHTHTHDTHAHTLMTCKHTHTQSCMYPTHTHDTHAPPHSYS